MTWFLLGVIVGATLMYFIIHKEKADKACPYQSECYPVAKDDKTVR